MGSYMSGPPSGGQPVVTDAPRLDLSALHRSGFIQAGQRTTCAVHFGRSADPATAVALYVDIDLTDPTASCLWVRDAAGHGPVRTQSVRLTATTPQYGGSRYWFICPLTGNRARVLYRPSGTVLFASRRAYGLAYRSQRQTMVDRLIDKAVAVRGKLGMNAVDLLSMPACPKPKGMHWRTYYQLVLEVETLRQRLWANAPM